MMKKSRNVKARSGDLPLPMMPLQGKGVGSPTDLKTLAIPKSVILRILPEASIKMFSGFRSRCYPREDERELVRLNF